MNLDTTGAKNRDDRGHVNPETNDCLFDPIITIKFQAQDPFDGILKACDSRHHSTGSLPINVRMMAALVPGIGQKGQLQIMLGM